MHACTANVWVPLPLPTHPSTLSLPTRGRLYVCWGSRPRERPSTNGHHAAAQPAPNGPKMSVSGTHVHRATRVHNCTSLRFGLGFSTPGASYDITLAYCSARALHIDAHSTWRLPSLTSQHRTLLRGGHLQQELTSEVASIKIGAGACMDGNSMLWVTYRSGSGCCLLLVVDLQHYRHPHDNVLKQAFSSAKQSFGWGH